MARVDRRVVLGAVCATVAVAGLAVAVAQGDDDGRASATVASGPGEVAAPTTTASSTASTTPPAAALAPGSVRVTPFAQVPADGPTPATVTGIVFRPGEPGTLYVPTKTGKVFAVVDGAVR